MAEAPVAESPAAEALAAEASAAEAPAGADDGRRHRNESAQADMNELTLYTFFVDALIDTPPQQIKALRRWMYAVIGLFDEDTALPQADLAASDRELLTLMRFSLWHRKGNPAVMPTPHLFLALHQISRLAMRRGADGPAPRPGRPEARWLRQWQSLVDVAEAEIKLTRARMAQDLRSADAGPYNGDRGLTPPGWTS